MRRLWPGTELTLAALALTVLLGWQTSGGRMFDALIGRPDVDERLIIAVAANDQADFEAALAAGASINARDAYGMSALAYAALTGSAARASELLRAGAEINSADHWGFTPLMHAARQDHAHVVALLLRHGANPSLRGPNGETAVRAAHDVGATRAASVLTAWDAARG